MSELEPASSILCPMTNLPCEYPEYCGATQRALDKEVIGTPNLREVDTPDLPDEVDKDLAKSAGEFLGMLLAEGYCSSARMQKYARLADMASQEVKMAYVGLRENIGIERERAKGK